MEKNDGILSSVTRDSSRTVTPISSATHKLDLMILEQRKLVENAQGGLQQSISLLQTAASKEECNSERLQILSLLSRTEELLVALKIINELRIEIGHVLHDIADSKKHYRDASSLCKRLQWLEQHLEKLLLSRKRGRPGVKGGRYQQKEIAGRSLRNHQSCQEAKILHNQSSKNTNDSIDTLSRGDTISVSVQDSTEGRDFQDRDKSIVSDVHKHLSQSMSSKQSANQDSDEWHSDSEANWTMIGNPLKDITQSQVLSEDEPKNNASFSHALYSASGYTVSQDTDKAITGISKKYTHHSVEIGSNIPLLTYGFEPPRPIEIFGTCSWNSLCLAVNSNVLQDTMDICDGSGRSMILLHAGLIGICEEVYSLRRLVQAAAVAATNPGSLLSMDSGVKQTSRVNSGWTQTSKAAHHMKRNEGKKTSLSLKLPSVNCKSNADCNSISTHRPHKIYDHKISWSHSVPRSSDEWCKRVVKEHLCQSTNTGEISKSKLLELKKTDVGSKNPLRNRNSYQQRFSWSDRHHCVLHSEDAIDRVKHQQKHVEHLTELLECSIIETRRESVQAISMLPTQIISRSLKDKLKDKFLKDFSVTVRYTAMKALLLHGVVDEMIIIAVCRCLEEGSQDLQLDLLQFLCQDMITTLLTQVENSRHLHGILTALISNDSTAVSFEAAVLLTKLGIVRDTCVERLHKALYDMSPATQSLALMCLVKNCGCYTKEVISTAIEQMHRLTDWKVLLKIDESL